MSIIGTFALMYVFGYSLDNLSLMALTLCVGFVVDDAIVMLENITRHMEMGKPRLQATLDGSKEIGFTIVSMTLSLAAVFIPVLFMGGIVGRLLHEFAVTIIVAVLISGFVSLTLTPMLCSRMLDDRAATQNTAASTRSQRADVRHAARRIPSAASHSRSRGVRLTMLACSARSSSQRRSCSHACPRAFFPSDDVGPAVCLHRSGAGHLVRRDDEPAAAGQRDRRARTRTSTASCRSWVRAGRRRRSTAAACSSR